MCIWITDVYKRQLIDNHNLPVEFANIQLLNPKDSSFLCGGVSNANGDFVIPDVYKRQMWKLSTTTNKIKTILCYNETTYSD